MHIRMMHTHLRIMNKYSVSEWSPVVPLMQDVLKQLFTTTICHEGLRLCTSPLFGRMMCTLLVWYRTTQMLGLVVILTTCCSPLVSCRNSNKTDDQQIWEDCKNATDSPNYYKNPDMYLDATGIIKRHGYPVEVHQVTTEDGYILELFRIPYSDKSRPGEDHKLPILLQHGIMTNSVNWLLPANNALAFRLADLGYDVWLGNSRGTSYSLGHVNPKMQHTTLKYWDFSWHEMGIYDIPAVIDHILETTHHQNLTYIGHSMGCTMFFVGMSLRPEYNSKINLMFGLAPVAFCGNLTSFFKLFAPFSYNFEQFYQILTTGQAIPEGLRRVLLPVLATSCSSSFINCQFCNNLYFLLFNSDGKQMNHTLLPVITSHFPDRVSMKTVSHYGQSIVTSNFQQFDPRIIIPGFRAPIYSSQGDPPAEYDMSKVTAPIVLFWAERDNLADPRDVARLIPLLPNLRASVKVCYPLFNHNDFLFGVYAKELVYDKLIRILQGSDDVDRNCEKPYVDHIEKES